MPSIKVGDEIVTLPSNETAHVKSIHVGDKESDSAKKGQPVTIQLDREVDVSRGCVLTVDSGAQTASSITATLLWMDDDILENGKKIKSIKAAYGGYTNGEKECAKLVKKFLNDLYNAGIMPWMIGHTKLKTVKDKASLDEEGFQRLGSSLIADYESAVADCFDIIATGLIDREIEEKGEGDSTKRYVKETERRLYFRGNEIVEAGGRLKDLSIPEYIPFDQLNMGQTFIDTIETALKNGRVDSVSTKKPTSKKATPVKEEKVAEPDPIEEDDIDDIDTPVEDTIEETTETSAYPDDLDAVIRKMYKECKDAELKASVKNVIAEYGKLNDVDEDGLKRIYDMMN